MSEKRSGNEHRVPGVHQAIYTVLKKELVEHFKTKRLIVIGIIFAIVFIVISAYGNYLVGGSVEEGSTYQAGPNEVFAQVMSFTSIFPAILAIALTYNTISGERTKHSLILLLSKPIDRISVFLGKFLASFFAISIVYFSVMAVGYGLVVALSGKVPSAGEVGRAFGAMGIVLLGIACWISFTMLFSTILKNATTTVVLLVALWIIILPLVSQIGFIYFVIDKTSGQEDKPENVDLAITGVDGLEFNDVMFMTNELGNPVQGVEITVTPENGSLNTTPLSVGHTTAFMNLPPGKYSWNAQLDSVEIDQGSFNIDGIHGFAQNITEGEDNRHNDVLVIVNKGLGPEQNATVTLRSPSGTVMTPSGTLGGIFKFEDLPEGEYDLTVVVENITIVQDTVYSYGDYHYESFFEVLMNPEFEYPDYVSVNYAMNPDNDMLVAVDLLEEGSDAESAFSFSMLTVSEGVIALIIFFLVTFLLGVVAFWRMEMN